LRLLGTPLNPSETQRGITPLIATDGAIVNCVTAVTARPSRP